MSDKVTLVSDGHEYRLPGWIAHWREQHESSDARISRPRQIYIGNRETRYLSRIDAPGTA